MTLPFSIHSVPKPSEWPCGGSSEARCAGSEGWLPRVPPLSNCWTRAGHLTHAVSLSSFTANHHLPCSVTKFTWDNTNFTPKTVRCHTTVRHSSGTAGDDTHESLSARVRVRNWVHVMLQPNPKLTSANGHLQRGVRVALALALQDLTQPCHGCGRNCSCEAFLIWDMTYPRPPITQSWRMLRPSACPSPLHGPHPRQISKERLAVPLPFCSLSGKSQRCQGCCENYGFLPRPVKTVMSKVWTWTIRKKSYVVNKRRGITRRSRLFSLQIVGKEKSEALKKIQYPLVVLNLNWIHLSGSSLFGGRQSQGKS